MPSRARCWRASHRSDLTYRTIPIPTHSPKGSVLCPDGQGISNSFACSMAPQLCHISHFQWCLFDFQGGLSIFGWSPSRGFLPYLQSIPPHGPYSDAHSPALQLSSSLILSPLPLSISLDSSRRSLAYQALPFGTFHVRAKGFRGVFQGVHISGTSTSLFTQTTIGKTSDGLPKHSWSGLHTGVARLHDIPWGLSLSFGYCDLSHPHHLLIDCSVFFHEQGALSDWWIRSSEYPIRI